MIWAMLLDEAANQVALDFWLAVVIVGSVLATLGMIFTDRVSRW